MSVHRVAVVIPTYNRALFIGEALASVVAQSRLPNQIIVADDGSTDQTADLVHRWSEQQRGVEVQLIRLGHRGVSAARNAGIRAANADLIALLDSDDLFLPHNLELLERGFDLRPDIVLCFADMQMFGEAGVLEPCTFPDTPLSALEYDEEAGGLRVIRGSAFTSLLPTSYIPTCGNLFSKKAAEAAGLFDETLRAAEDREFWLRLSRIGKFAYYPEVVGRLRRHPQNTTHERNLATNKIDHLRALQKIVGLADELGCSAEEREHACETMATCAEELLYAASRDGLAMYLRACPHLKQGLFSRAFNAKHVLRALRSSFGKELERFRCRLDPGGMP